MVKRGRTSIEKTESRALREGEVNNEQRMPLDSRFYVLVLFLALSGGFALFQGGLWIAVLLYILNLLALLNLKNRSR